MKDMSNMENMDNSNMGGKSGMNNARNSQYMYVHNSFWLPDRVSLTFQVTLPQGEQVTLETVRRVIPTRLAIINEQLRQGIKQDDFQGASLQFFDDKESATPDAPLPLTYLFVSPSAPNTAQVVSFLEINHPGPRLTDMAHGVVPVITNTLNAVYRREKAIARAQTEDVAEPQAQVAVLGCSPTWLTGATGNPDPFGYKGTGCPLSPPVPVPASLSCVDAPGRYPITLPDMPHDLQTMTGDGVTVIVLDSLPKQGQLARAVEMVEDHNLLMLDVVSNVTINEYHITDGSDTAGPNEPETGKDIYGRLIGFRIPDHGLFVAGIIRDVAPDANVECYRIFNDFCAGSVQSIIDVLTKIYGRMSSQAGDLYGKPVVINMSLVIPADEDVINAGIDPNSLNQTRASLLAVIQNLIDVGAIFVASAGNEGDRRYNPMGMSNERPNALYPAAFVYNGLTNEQMHGMIPVGAVSADGLPTDYSCYPGPNGVACYGGSLPNLATDVGKNSGGMSTVQMHDAVIGLYSSLNYPALSLDDPQAEYPAPNSYGWAYWVGTSFATPIVSGVAARALELRLRNPSSVQTLTLPNIVSGAATGTVTWDRLGTGTIPHVNAVDAQGLLIHAVQCKGEAHHQHHGHHMHEAEEHEEVEVNVTNVYEM